MLLGVIGDASYVWYLVHWPVIQAIKYYYCLFQFTIYGAFGGIAFEATIY